MGKNLVLLVVVLVVGLLVGCGAPLMNLADMHKVPSLQQMPETFTIIWAQQNPDLFVATGIRNKCTWPAVIWDSKGVKHPALAVNLQLQRPIVAQGQRYEIGLLDMFVLTSVPAEDIQYFAIAERGGGIAYNREGKGRGISSFDNLKPGEHADFFQLNSGFVRSVGRDSAEFQLLVEMHKAAFKLDEDIYPYLQKVKEKYRDEFKSHDYNIPSERLEQIMKQDSNFYKLGKALSEKWLIVFSLPILGVEEMALTMLIQKAFELPSFYATHDVPGLMEYKAQAGDVAEMIRRGFMVYGAGAAQPISYNESLPQDFLDKIKGTPCEVSRTYEQYSRCVSDYNRGVERYNKNIK